MKGGEKQKKKVKIKLQMEKRGKERKPEELSEKRSRRQRDKLEGA